MFCRWCCALVVLFLCAPASAASLSQINQTITKSKAWLYDLIRGGQ